MRSIKFEIHPMSALAGALVVLIALGAVGAARVANLTRVAVVNPLTIRGAYDPRNAVQISEGVPYTVPPSRVLALTAIGDSSSTSSFVQIQIDGTQAFFCNATTTSSSPLTIKAVPGGLTAAAGSLVTVTASSSPANTGRAWGYLVDA